MNSNNDISLVAEEKSKKNKKRGKINSKREDNFKNISNQAAKLKKTFKNPLKKKDKNKQKNKPEDPNKEIILEENLVPMVIDATTEKHLEKLAGINAAILDYSIPLPLEVQYVLLEDVRRVELEFKLTNNSNELLKAVEALNQKVTAYRAQQGDIKNKELELQIQNTLDKQTEEIKYLQKKTDSLEEYSGTFRKYTPKKKSSSFLSFFKCLPCCSSDNDEKNEVASEHHPLLSK